jgi:hypothetical protein
MGQCITTKQGKVKPDETSDIDSKISTTRGDVMKLIHSFHIICLDCSDGIERSIIQNDREVAVLLRLKYLFLKEKSKLLQDAMGNIDSLSSLDKPAKKKETIQQIEVFLEGLNGILILRDVEKILERDKDYCEIVSKEVKRHQINQQDAENFVDQEINDRNASPSRKKRRRYSRKLTNL